MANRTPEQQIEHLANYIMGNLPGEPSQDQGAIETIIRLHDEALVKIAALERGQTNLVNAIGDAIAEYAPLTH